MRSVGAALVKLIATATSGLVSFTTNVIRPVKVTCKFSPVQEGTGDPSPDNVRPISGWNGCKIGNYNNDLLETVAWHYNAILNPGGGTAGNNPYCYTESYQDVVGSKYVVCTLSGEVTNRVNFCFYDSEKKYLSGVQPITTAGITEYENWREVLPVPEGCKYIRWSIIAAQRTRLRVFAGETIPITFTDPSTGDPLTVYGGTVTLNEDGSADLVATQIKMTMTEYFVESGRNIEMVNGYLCRLYALSTITAPIICNTFKTVTGKYWGYFPTVTGNECQYSGGYLAFASSTLGFTTKAEWEAYLKANVEICAMLVTPQTYHFDNIGQLQSFLGTNNIWHDMNGSITAEYYKKQ